MGSLIERTEHLGATDKIGAPNPPESLVEFGRIQRVNTLPIAVEALHPGIERQRIVTAQVFDVENLETAVLHQRDRVGETRNPTTGEHVIADEEFGFAAPDVADEMQHAESARLQELRVRANHVLQLIPPRVLEDADRYDFVERPERIAKIGFDNVDAILEPARLNQLLHFVDLLRRRVDAGHQYAVSARGVKHEAAEAATDVDHRFTGPQQQLAADMLDLVDLRFLERLRALAPIPARVHHQRVVEPKAVEVGPKAVVGASVYLGALAARVRAAKF